MNLKAIFNVVGILLILLSGILLVPLAIALFYADPALPGHRTPLVRFSQFLHRLRRYRLLSLEIFAVRHRETAGTRRIRHRRRGLDHHHLFRRPAVLPDRCLPRIRRRLFRKHERLHHHRRLDSHQHRRTAPRHSVLAQPDAVVGRHGNHHFVTRYFPGTGHRQFPVVQGRDTGRCNGGTHETAPCGNGKSLVENLSGTDPGRNCSC